MYLFLLLCFLVFTYFVWVEGKDEHHWADVINDVYSDFAKRLK